MKKNISTTFIFAIVLLVTACKKDPSDPIASFTTNMSEYIAGDTVHLTNNSAFASAYQWTMPDGQTVNTTNAYYIIPSNQGFASLTFQLEAFNGNVNNSVSKTVGIIPASTFDVDATAYLYYPLNVATTPNGSNWWIYATVHSEGVFDPNPANASAYLRIELPSTLAPVSSGTYLLQSNDVLAPGYAYILIQRRWWEDNYEKFISSSGQLQITITNGKVHAVFDHVDAIHTDVFGTIYPNVTISGDITCH